MLEQTEGLYEVPMFNGRKMALIEQDEYSFVAQSLNRWADRRFADKPVQPE